MDTSSFVTLFAGLFAITAPIAALPIFIAATDGQADGQRRKTALIATATYIVICFIGLFVGNAVMGFFGVSVAALRVAGMAVIAVIGWRMLNAPTPCDHDAPGNEETGTGRGPPVRAHLLHAASNTRVAKADRAGPRKMPSPIHVGIMPLGFPIYAGPGALSLIIAWSGEPEPVYLVVLAAILANAAIIIVLDFLAAPISRLVGAEGLLVTEKVFGLIVVAIAVTGMASALLVLFPGLAVSRP